jgi:hypothetical protein
MPTPTLRRAATSSLPRRTAVPRLPRPRAPSPSCSAPLDASESSPRTTSRVFLRRPATPPWTAGPFPVAPPSCVRRAARCGPPVPLSPRPVRDDYKREAGTSRSCRPFHRLRAAPPRRHGHAHAELYPTPLPSADYHPSASSSPHRSSTPARSRCRGSTSPKQGGTAASTGRRCCATSPAPLPLRTPTEIEPPDPSGPPPPAPGWSGPPVRRNLAGPPPASARGRHCKVCNFFGVFCVK